MDISRIKVLDNIHTTWRDYALLLVNSTNGPLRQNWRGKIVTMMIHSQFFFNSVFESHLIGLQILSELPNWLTKKVVDDVWEYGKWEFNERCVGSKRPKIRLGHLPQDSLDNEALMCMEWILDHWNEHKDIIFNSKLLSSIWQLAQDSGGKCLYPDEVLTYQLDKKIGDLPGAWIDVCRDVFTNGIPSQTYKKYWYSTAIPGFPLAAPATEAEAIENMRTLLQKALKEDTQSCASWKRACICVLKNDVSWKYAGFATSSNDRLTIVECLKAFRESKEGQAILYAALKV